MHRILGVVAGLVAAIATVFVCEAIGHAIFPPPPGIDLSDPAATADIFERIPFGAKLAVVIAWLLGAFAGAWVARAIGRWTPAAWIVAALVTLGGVATLVMIPHPLWMQVSAVVLPFAGAWAATRMPARS